MAIEKFWAIVSSYCLSFLFSLVWEFSRGSINRRPGFLQDLFPQEVHIAVIAKAALTGVATMQQVVSVDI